MTEKVWNNQHGSLRSFLPHSSLVAPNGYLSEVDAPYVRYIPAPSPSSGSTISGRSSASSAHDFTVANAQGIQIVSLPQYRVVCSICMEDFQSSQVEKTEPPERLRKLPCKHIFHVWQPFGIKSASEIAVLLGKLHYSRDSPITATVQLRIPDLPPIRSPSTTAQWTWTFHASTYRILPTSLAEKKQPTRYLILLVDFETRI